MAELPHPQVILTYTSISCGISELKTASVEISSQRENVAKVEKMLLNLEREFQSDRFNNLIVAVSELVLNAIVHGNKEDPARLVKVTVSYDDSEMTVKVLDEGGGFDVSKIPDPTLTGNVFKTSGRGLYIVKQLVDNLECFMTPEGSVCILTLRKSVS